MNELLLHAATTFMGFFAIMNPVASVPVFLGLTAHDDAATTRTVARRSLLIAFVIVLIFCVAGRIIFDVFGITLAAFRITGGLLVLFIGFQMLQGNSSPVQQLSDEDHQKAIDARLGVAVSPLAMPILAGPGTIATAMNFSADGGVGNIIVTMASFGALCGVTYLLFRFGGRFISYIGAGALSVVTRVMGLIIAVIGTQMIITGVHGAVILPL